MLGASGMEGIRFSDTANAKNSSKKGAREGLMSAVGCVNRATKAAVHRNTTVR